MQLGLSMKSISRVGLNSKKPPMNCHLRWMDSCGTLVLVPNCALGKVMSGVRVLLSIKLFQYCHPTVNWLSSLDENAEFRVRLATCKWFLVKLPSVRSKLPPLWSFRLLLACV